MYAEGRRSTRGRDMRSQQFEFLFAPLNFCSFIGTRPTSSVGKSGPAVYGAHLLKVRCAGRASFDSGAGHKLIACFFLVLFRIINWTSIPGTIKFRSAGCAHPFPVVDAARNNVEAPRSTRGRAIAFSSVFTLDYGLRFRQFIQCWFVARFFFCWFNFAQWTTTVREKAVQMSTIN
jgi:hypothetical protein